MIKQRMGHSAVFYTSYHERETQKQNNAIYLDLWWALSYKINGFVRIFVSVDIYWDGTKRTGCIEDAMSALFSMA